MAKPRRQKLKVFRTPIGFHDAYVAAPSRKAALAAWGSGTDLFSAGIAEEATDDAPGTKAALAEPGEVVRVARTAGKDGPSPRRSSESGRGRKQAKPRPKPSRAQLDKAEASLAQVEQRQAAERAGLAKEEEKMAKRRRALEEKHRKARAAAEAKRDAAKERYRAAMADWVG